MAYEKPYPGAVDPDPAVFRQLVSSGELICFRLISLSNPDAMYGEAYLKKSSKNNPPGIREQMLESLATVAMEYSPPLLVREMIADTKVDHQPEDILAGTDGAVDQNDFSGT